MGRADYQEEMRHRLQDLGFSIARIRRRLGGPVDDRTKVDLTGRLAGLERRREQLEHRLETLGDEPDGAWSRLKNQFDLEWFDLMQDFEDRVGRLL